MWKSDAMPRRPAPLGQPQPARHSDARLALAFLLGAAALYIFQALLETRRPASRPAEAENSVVYVLDLNSAKPAELAQLPGIGPKIAKAIHDTRLARGPFESFDDLQDVPGIGPKRRELFKGHLQIVPQPVIPYQARPEPPIAQPAKALLVDLNTAGQDELMRLPAIGPVMARRIIDDRSQNGPFGSPADITRVKGIKSKTFQKIEPYITTNSGTFSKAQ